MRRTLALLAILFSSTYLIAGESAVIAGTVRDESGAAVAGSSVRLDAVSGRTYRTAKTSSSGEFRFEQVALDRVVLVVEAPGLSRYVAEVAPGAELLRITLPVGALAQQVTVTATGMLEDLDASPRATTVLDRGEMDRRIEFSVVESLREVPGVRITQLGGPGTSANIRIRGLRAQDTAVLIDGMRLRDPAATQADASAFTGDLLTLNISRLEVLRGCGSALYGSNAMGGVVNIVSEPGGGKLRGEWLGEGGGLGFLRSQVRLSGGAADDRLTYSLGAGHLNVLEGIDGDDRARNSSAQGFVQFHARENVLLSARVSAANTFLGLNLSPSLTANAPRSGVVQAIPLSEEAMALRDRGLPFALGNATVLTAANDPDSHRASWLTSALFAADHQLTGRTSYRVAYQLVDTRRSFPNGPGGVGFQPVGRDVSTFDGRIDTLQARLNHAAERHLLSVGGEWEREAFHNGGAGAGSSYRAQVAQRSAAVFGEDRLRFLEGQLQVTLSGRVQQFSLQRPRLTGDLPEYLSTPVPDAPSAFTGDASVMYRIARSNTKLRAHFGNAYRAPSLFERYGTGYFGGVFTPYGDPRLEPERSLGGDAGIDQYFGARKARLSATYFYTQLRSVIGFDFTGLINRTTDPFGRSSGYFSTAGGLARGVELEGQVALWRGFQINGSYTHTRTLERQAIALGTLRTPRIFTHTVAFSAMQTWRRLTVTSNFLGAPEFLGVISGRAVSWPGPRRLDATASYKLARWERVQTELHGRVENLLNQQYFEDGYRTPRRWVVAGLRVSF